MIKIILLIDCASEFDRKLLRGMMRYSKQNGPWLFYRIPSAFRHGSSREEAVISLAKKWNADAIIGRWNDGKANLLGSLNIPIVLQNNTMRSDVYSNLTGDYEGTGRMAANYFRKKLYTNYAFFGVRGLIWSEERCRGFENEVISGKTNFFSYKEEPDGTDERDAIIKWLQQLPKPVALFCCDDAHALFITETCLISGINVPDEVSILGVDDDELLCSISDPPVSSIELDVEEGGYMACKMLHRQLLTGNMKPFNIVIRPLSIRERSSSTSYNVSDRYVLDIVKFIEENYSKDIEISSLLDLVPLSRRSIEMRFKKAMDMTIWQYLLRVRVKHFAYLLRTTDRSILDIAYESGFSDLSNVSRVFKKYMGCTPSEYKKGCCAI